MSRNNSHIAIAFVVVLTVSSLALAAPMDLDGVGVNVKSKFNGGPWEVRSSTIDTSEPGLEFEFGDGNEFSWMHSGDAIDIGTRTNPIVPWKVDFIIGETFEFESTDTLEFYVWLDDDYGFAEPAAIVSAINIGGNVNFLSETLDVNLHSLDQTYGQAPSHLEIALNVVPEPASLSLLGLGGLALLRRRRPHG